MTAYLESYNFKTVYVSPFSSDALNNRTMKMWIGKAKEFFIRKTADGKRSVQ